MIPKKNQHQFLEFKNGLARLYLMFSTMLVAVNGATALVEYQEDQQFLSLVMGASNILIAIIIFMYCIYTIKTKDLTKIKYITPII